MRRYLDDEAILARPPSKIGKAIKWARRHPWRFSFGTAALVLAALTTDRLYTWVCYQRPHLEYAAAVDYVNGALESARKVSHSQAEHRAVTLRLTRRGLRGPITRVEVLNPRGHPASIRRLMLEEFIPLYIESLTGMQPLGEKTPETTSVEQLYDGRVVRELIGRNRDGSVNWRILYDRAIESTGASVVLRARVMNLRGLEVGSRKGATIMEFERDAAGHDKRVSFFDSAGKPAANGEGVYGYELDRDDRGRVARLVNLDRNGKPAPNRAGFTGCTMTWGPDDRVACLDVRDEAGRLASWNGLPRASAERAAALRSP